MGNKDIIKQMQTLEQKANDIRDKYAKALVNAKQEKAELLQDIADGEEQAKDFYKSYVLNEISLSGYQDVTKQLSDKKNSLKFLEQKINSIEGMKKDELYEVVSEYKQIQKDFIAEDNKNRATQRKKLLEAKVNYLKEMRKAKQEVMKTHKFNRIMEEIEVEVGTRKDVSYDFDHSLVRKMLPNSYGNTAGITVTENEAIEAFYKNEVVPYALQLEGIKE